MSFSGGKGSNHALDTQKIESLTNCGLIVKSPVTLESDLGSMEGGSKFVFI